MKITSPLTFDPKEGLLKYGGSTQAMAGCYVDRYSMIRS